MNVLGAPDERDSIRPIVVEQQFGFPAALEQRTEYFEEFSDEVFHG